MPAEGAFYNLHDFPSWTQYALSARSTVTATGVDDPEEVVLLQLTISETCLLSLGLLVLARLFPEFVGIASDLSQKVTAVSHAQGFLRDATLDDE